MFFILNMLYFIAILSGGYLMYEGEMGMGIGLMATGILLFILTYVYYRRRQRKKGEKSDYCGEFAPDCAAIPDCGDIGKGFKLLDKLDCDCGGSDCDCSPDCSV